MGYINIERKELVNLKYGLQRELIRSNRAGSYASSTIIGCNTRRYHGLLIVPFSDSSKHVLLSELGESVIQDNKHFRLDVRRYEGGKYDPHGQRYLNEFHSDPIPARIYRVGTVQLKKELLLAEDEERIMVRYTILKASSKTTLRLKPFLAFRDVHDLQKENMALNKKFTEVDNGISVCLYDNYPNLYMQISRKNTYVAAPDWYYNIEYSKEKDRGYPATEDLFIPGYFDIKVKAGDKIVFSAGTTQTNTKSLTRKFTSQANKRTPRDNFEHCLINSAQQFFVKRGNQTLLKAGYHWYNFRFREALVALAGLTLSYNDEKTFIATLDTTIELYKKEQQDLPTDIHLLIFRTIQQYIEYTKNEKLMITKYGKLLVSIIGNIFSGDLGVQVRENGLLYISDTTQPKTWMAEMQNGKPIIERYGYVVEINALWYNSLCFMKQYFESCISEKLLSKIQETVSNIETSFYPTFWNKDEFCLFDFVTDNFKNAETRPNQIYAISLPFSPLKMEIKKAIFDKIKNNLFTNFGLRTLSPRNSKFVPKYAGYPDYRNNARNQGTVHPFLQAQYCDAIKELVGKAGLRTITAIYENFEPEMHIHGIGTISELYDGNAPHKARGAISYAPSVGELLRIKMIINELNNSI